MRRHDVIIVKTESSVYECRTRKIRSIGIDVKTGFFADFDHIMKVFYSVDTDWDDRELELVSILQSCINLNKLAKKF